MNRIIKLPYGKGFLDAEIPEERLAAILRPAAAQPATAPQPATAGAARAVSETPTLSTAAQPAAESSARQEELSAAEHASSDATQPNATAARSAEAQPAAAPRPAAVGAPPTVSEAAHSAAAQTELVRRALQNPIGSPRLRDLARNKENIVLIASDHTRPVPSSVILPAVLEELELAGYRGVLTVLIATGFHRPTTREELIYKFGPRLADDPRLRFVVHESGKSEDMMCAGVLPSGIPLRISRLAAEADLLLAEGFIEPHFFAGFSGGRKSVLPGIADRTTVLANHCSKFIAHPCSRTGVLEGNPIHRDMVRAAELADLAFIVNVVLDGEKRVADAFAGHFNEAHLAGCRSVSRLAGVEAVPADIVISTNGGYPLDQNIYQAVKGMTAAEAACRPGGVIIMVSACSDGHGGQSFYETFAQQPSAEAIMERFLATEQNDTVPDQWESQILCRILLKYRVIMVTDAPRDMVRAMHMEWAPDIAEALRMADRWLGGKGSVSVIPDGVSVIVKRSGC
ncbi:nickel-dependent lactate racemase [Bacilliculturomica massiliensis]|uniref:nickel-dependent lactate racemase n=1 Tax=Bacilliculturomica massiliensis TaxID=1917867 RepID=UPI00102FE046|nr:nickel-dependent lactate racemase [Bacilliculturomica massiliensis]